MVEKKTTIAVIGLGYVGLPLAAAFAEKHEVIGFDINQERITELETGLDSTLEIHSDYLKSIIQSKPTQDNGLYVTSDVRDLEKCNIYIIAVPTPIDKFNRPSLSPMIGASEIVASCLRKDDIVIYESTVYPGVTEEEMVPLLEKCSGLKYNSDFYCGYSPERINPGDKERTIKNIIKVTSGSTPQVATIIDELYKSIITAGTHKATSIKVAEASKVIENCQRDLNIAFVNELSKIFSLLDIDTNDVLEAAGTKWNFLNFQPGLVGGHCIGVDPYYLAQRAQEFGYHPEIILAGRRLNDRMGQHVATEVVKLMMKNSINVVGSNVLLLGFTFKENCPDIRNTKVIDIYKELETFDVAVHICDPWADPEESRKEYGVNIIKQIPEEKKYDAIILAVAHDDFRNLPLRDSLQSSGLIYDVKGVLPKSEIDARL